MEQCFDAKVPSWRTSEQYAHLKMYLKILAQYEQSVMTTFVRLGLPWMTAHMSDLLAHCGQLQKLPRIYPSVSVLSSSWVETIAVRSACCLR